MPSALDSLLPPNVVSGWNKARKKYKSSGGTAQAANIFDSLYGATAAARDRFRVGMTTAILATPEGKTIVDESEKVRVKEYLRNPSVLIVLAVVVGAFFLLGKKS